MLKALAALAFLVCASHGRREVLTKADDSQALALLLLARNPAAAFNLRAKPAVGTRSPAGSGGHHRHSMMSLDLSGDAKFASPGMSRRKAVAALLGLGLAAAGPGATNAADSVIVSGSVSLPNGETGTKESGALYVTARPPNDWKDALTAARGQSSGNKPPIAVARYPAPLKFPFEFALKDPTDVTPEGADPKAEPWNDKDLTVVVRYDSDGVVATRGKDDLTGQVETTRVDGKIGSATVELKPRPGFVASFMSK